MKRIALDSRITRRDDFDTMDVDDATIIANAGGGDCYGLELIARRIWQLLPGTATVAELCEMLLKEYDIDRETCEREVLEFLNDSIREGLIQTDS
jgi:hypothetical protein